MPNSVHVYKMFTFCFFCELILDNVVPQKVAANKWAAATTISTQAFMKLTDSDKIIITQPKKHTIVKAFTGELTVVGLVVPVAACCTCGRYRSPR